MVHTNQEPGSPMNASPSPNGHGQLHQAIHNMQRELQEPLMQDALKKLAKELKHDGNQAGLHLVEALQQFENFSIPLLESDPRTMELLVLFGKQLVSGLLNITQQNKQKKQQTAQENTINSFVDEIDKYRKEKQNNQRQYFNQSQQSMDQQRNNHKLSPDQFEYEYERILQTINDPQRRSLAIQNLMHRSALGKPYYDDIQFTSRSAL